MGTLELTAWSLSFAGLLVTPFYLWAAPGLNVVPQPRQLALLVFLALVPGNGHLLINWAHTRLSAALSSLLLSLIPILASLWAYLLFDEPYGTWHVVGALLTVAAIELGRRAVEPPSRASSARL